MEAEATNLLRTTSLTTTGSDASVGVVARRCDRSTRKMVGSVGCYGPERTESGTARTSAGRHTRNRKSIRRRALLTWLGKIRFPSPSG